MKLGLATELGLEMGVRTEPGWALEAVTGLEMGVQTELGPMLEAVAELGAAMEPE